MVLELIPAGLAVMTVCIAVYTDLFRGRIIPDKLTLPMIAVGVIFQALLGV